MKRRNKYLFDGIESSDSFKELKQLKKLPCSRQLIASSIMGFVDDEIQQVKKGIRTIYEVVEKDIELEKEQMNKVELQLRKSLKKVNHHYRKIRARRTQNSEFLVSQSVDDISGNLSTLKQTSDYLETTINVVLGNIFKIDSGFPEKSRLLNDEVFNEHHYPLFYQLIRRKYPEAIKKVTPTESTHIDQDSITIEVLSSSGKLSEPEVGLNNDEIAKSIEDTISNYRTTRLETHNRSLTSKSDVLLPPSLKEVKQPVTSITYETVNALGFEFSSSQSFEENFDN